MEDFELDALAVFGIANPTPKPIPKVSSSQTLAVSDEEYDQDQMLLDLFGVESTPKEANRTHKKRKKKRKKDRDRVKEDTFVVNDLQDEDATLSYFELCDNLYYADEMFAKP